MLTGCSHRRLKNLNEFMEIESDLLTARTELIELEFERDKLLPINEKFMNYVKKHTLDICAGGIGVAAGLTAVGCGCAIIRKMTKNKVVIMEPNAQIYYF